MCVKWFRETNFWNYGQFWEKVSDIIIPEKLITLSYVKKCREIYHTSLIIRQKVSVLYNTDTLRSILALYVLLNLLMPILNLLMPLFQPPDATFSIFQECQSCESEVLVWVSPNHSSSTRDLEKPILALPLHRIGPLLGKEKHSSPTVYRGGMVSLPYRCHIKSEWHFNSSFPIWFIY